MDVSCRSSVLHFVVILNEPWKCCLVIHPPIRARLNFLASSLVNSIYSEQYNSKFKLYSSLWICISAVTHKKTTSTTVLEEYHKNMELTGIVFYYFLYTFKSYLNIWSKPGLNFIFQSPPSCNYSVKKQLWKRSVESVQK